ncbi:MAG: MFS transporter, partial [Sciscionella sp.]
MWRSRSGDQRSRTGRTRRWGRTSAQPAEPPGSRTGGAEQVQDEPRSSVGKLPNYARQTRHLTAQQPQPSGEGAGPAKPGPPNAGVPKAGIPKAGPQGRTEPPSLQPQPPNVEHSADAAEDRSAPRLPNKITVTRVAAWRSRQLGKQAVGAFSRAAKADGADSSGLTALTYATMLNYASDATMAVALANTLFFS